MSDNCALVFSSHRGRMTGVEGLLLLLPLRGVGGRPAPRARGKSALKVHTAMRDEGGLALPEEAHASRTQSLPVLPFAVLQNADHGQRCPSTRDRQSVNTS